MADLRFQFIDDTLFDFYLENADLATGQDLHSAVIVSLFTDRRARIDDPLPYDAGSRRGWWGDTFEPIQGDRIGSRLWLLSREKQTQATLARAQEYCREALRWLIEDGVASRVDVEVTYPRMGVMAIFVGIDKPTGREEFRFDYPWQQIQADVVEVTR
jgi:phage gp46-like protein